MSRGKQQKRKIKRNIWGGTNSTHIGWSGGYSCAKSLGAPFGCSEPVGGKAREVMKSPPNLDKRREKIVQKTSKGI